MSNELVDLIAEKEALIADITKQLAAAKKQLEALTAPKVGDIYHHVDNSKIKAVVLGFEGGRVFYRFKMPSYAVWDAKAAWLGDFNLKYKKV